VPAIGDAAGVGDGVVVAAAMRKSLQVYPGLPE